MFVRYSISSARGRRLPEEAEPARLRRQPRVRRGQLEAVAVEQRADDDGLAVGQLVPAGQRLDQPCGARLAVAPAAAAGAREGIDLGAPAPSPAAAAVAADSPPGRGDPAGCNSSYPHARQVRPSHHTLLDDRPVGSLATTIGAPSGWAPARPSRWTGRGAARRTCGSTPPWTPSGWLVDRPLQLGAQDVVGQQVRQPQAGEALLAGPLVGASSSRASMAATNGRWSPTTTAWLTSGCARADPRGAGATFLPAAWTISSFLRPVIRR